MRRSIKRILKRALWSILVIGVVLLSLRSFRVLGGPPLQPWHTFVPQELRADQLDAADWPRYLAQEDEIMTSVRAEVSQKLAPDQRVPINRYFEASPVYPARFAHDWNRSYVMEPDGKPVGVVVLLHGLTRFALQPAPYRKTLSRSRLCRDRHPHAGPRHRAGRADRRPLGRLDGRDAAGRARSTSARACSGTAASGRLLERRRTGDEILARRAGKPATSRAPIASSCSRR